MLNSQGDVVIPPETHFFKTNTLLENKFREDSRAEYRTKLLDFWYGHKTRIRDMRLDRDQVERAARKLGLYRALELFTLHLTLYRVERQKTIVGEKTPSHILHTEKILEAYPDAKIISLFRDPRAAAYSEIKAYFGSPSVVVTTRRWRAYVQKHKQLENKLPASRYMMLRYCDLVAAPEAVLNRVCRFLEIPYRDDMLWYYQRDEKGFAEGEKDWKSGTFKPIKKNKNEEWKTGLRSWQVSLVEQWAGKYLEEMGYQPHGGAMSKFRSVPWHLLDLGRSAWADLTNARDEGYRSPAEFDR